jgi:hypothetical protein
VTAIGHDRVNRASLDRAIELAVAAGVAILVAIGFVTSYETLRQLAITDGGFAPWLAPAVPLSFDLGIVVLSLKIVAAARRGRHALVHRALVSGLSVATVAVNGTASTGTAGQLLHSIPPAMFVICFEGLVADARRDALAGRRPRTGRWKASLLAPVTTLRAWREGVVQSASLDTAQAKGPKSPVRPSRQTAPTQTRPTPSLTRSPSVTARTPDHRLTLTREALREDPNLPAPALARALRDHGHEVSVRTAQRLKARAACTD